MNQNGQGYNWRAWFCIVDRETGGTWNPLLEPYDVNGYRSRGLFQINDQWHAWRWNGKDWRDPAVQARVAIDIWREFGFQPWSTRWLCGLGGTP